jgi:hypothetical protein
MKLKGIEAIGTGCAMIDLRPYQGDVIAAIERAIAAGTRRIIAVAPTGAGETIIAASIIKGAVSNGHSIPIADRKARRTRTGSRPDIHRDCWTAHSSEAMRAAGSRISTGKNSGCGQHGVRSLSRSRRRQKSAVGSDRE